MKTASILTIGCAAMALSITSCTNFGSPNTYNLNEIGGAQETYTGTVTSVETSRSRPITPTPAPESAPWRAG